MLDKVLWYNWRNEACSKNDLSAQSRSVLYKQQTLVGPLVMLLAGSKVCFSDLPWSNLQAVAPENPAGETFRTQL